MPTTKKDTKQFTNISRANSTPSLKTRKRNLFTIRFAHPIQQDAAGNADPDFFNSLHHALRRVCAQQSSPACVWNLLSAVHESPAPFLTLTLTNVAPLSPAHPSPSGYKIFIHLTSKKRRALQIYAVYSNNWFATPPLHSIVFKRVYALKEIPATLPDRIALITTEVANAMRTTAVALTPKTLKKTKLKQQDIILPTKH